jgi:hypothetical protein
MGWEETLQQLSKTLRQNTFGLCAMKKWTAGRGTPAEVDVAAAEHDPDLLAWPRRHGQRRGQPSARRRLDDELHALHAQTI